ncbi:MAG: exonuclease domain-containing protein [Oscillospiraceae bacterium]|nr:exonuclease domain-containing protein [Oscillospiraceae bacterium]
MQYIVLDMEWNQPWPGSYSAQKVLPVQIHGEIIQIGAVRVSDTQEIGDEFQQLILPKYYRRLNKRVSSLTGIKEAQLREEGKPFPEVIEAFRAWCGEDCIFLTWGFDDINILKENMALHGLDNTWVDRWYNAQLIFNAQTDGSSAQKALKTAMAIFDIEPSRPAHDALGDAYHTAVICTRLDLQRGITEYGAARKQHEEGFHGAEIPGCISRRVFRGFANKDAVIKAMAGSDNLCPLCKRKMRAGRWISQPGHRYMAMMKCSRHGEYLVRIRLIREEDETFRVSRLLYTSDSEAAAAYRSRIARLQPEQQRRKRLMPSFLLAKKSKKTKKNEE